MLPSCVCKYSALVWDIQCLSGALLETGQSHSLCCLSVLPGKAPTAAPDLEAGGLLCSFATKQLLKEWPPNNVLNSGIILAGMSKELCGIELSLHFGLRETQGFMAEWSFEPRSPKSWPNSLTSIPHEFLVLPVTKCQSF